MWLAGRGIGRESERSRNRQRHCEALFHCQLTSSFVFLAMILNVFGRVYVSLQEDKKIKYIQDAYMKTKRIK